MFGKFKKSIKADSIRNLNIDDLDESALPVLNAGALIKLLDQENRIQSIQQLSGIGQKHYSHLYKSVIDSFIESCQLVPASTSHHHAGLGGLIVHTLEVVERALRIRKDHELPQNTNPETIALQEHVWTYGVFIGAILHDAAKLVTNYRLVLSNGSDWNVFGKSIQETGADSYKIEFLKSVSYVLHSKLGATFFYMIPPAGRQWVASYSVLMNQLSSYLQNDPYESGVIGDIVRESDGYSVAENIRIGGDKVRLQNAPTIPLVQKLIMALRQLLENQEIKVNASGGGAGWVEGQYTYIACAVVAEKITAYLRASGATDIPTDNSRIFDILQEHGFAVPNENNKAIWSVKILGAINEDNKPSYGPYHLTMLKFETNRIFHPSHRPLPFGGTIEIDTGTTSSNIYEPEPDKVTEQKTETNNEWNKKNETAPETNSATDAEDDPFAQTTSNCSSLLSQSETKEHDDKCETETDIDDLASNDQNTVATPKGIMDPEIGKIFVDWVKRAISEKSILINKIKARIHIVDEGVLLVSPGIFFDFIENMNLTEPNSNKMDAVKRVQNRLSKLKLNILTPGQRMNIHTYKIKGDNKESSIKGLLFPLSVFYPDGENPKPNKYILSKKAIEANNDGDQDE